MNNLKNITKLFDIYGSLLSKKQQIYFIEHYFDDLSLGEIAHNHNISRSAIHFAINNALKELQDYEKKLLFLSKQEKRIKIFQSINDKKLSDKLILLEFQQTREKK